MAHNPNMPLVEAPRSLHPLWVRCDKSDPCATAWLGVEAVYSGNKTSGVKLYTVSCKGSSAYVLFKEISAQKKISLCKQRQHLFIFQCSGGPTADETSFTTLDELKQEHEKRHHASTVRFLLLLLFSSYRFLTVRYLVRILCLFFFR